MHTFFFFVLFLFPLIDPLCRLGSGVELPEEDTLEGRPRLIELHAGQPAGQVHCRPAAVLRARRTVFCSLL